ncbi:hypothetical protein COT87_00965 [Candidatus Collierbacteria bacterium CG10_big_fil_rev_8_21_14_0_10_44_9]|uniref:Glycosyltransferase 2-like domain-containing protein n=1 Tax=Candidatus Collierbacteria bacterium CG10_big_fil_rev_8_21_14_0_10_44_9 TaxID=1974535 RepID=A0A2H0VJ79_9BACT|nr:MAG: hypothetical protein COT87_00965 [Candidatus Collierbacteria bacterium CG10_big_fil_rev_8_21_14_0_10_44_9]
MNNLTIITLNQPNITDFSAARNKELAKTKTSWVLFLDSDETLSPELESEIDLTINHQPSTIYSAYAIPRLDTFLGRELHHGEPGHAKFIRLARRDFGKWVRPVHEKWIGKGAVGSLKNPILHTPHPSISLFLNKINTYSTLDAQYRYIQGIKSSLWKIAIYPIAKFKWNYLFKLGFLDGTPGIIMAMMMSFHSYLTWTKLYLLWHKK